MIHLFKVLADKPTHVRIQDPYLAARHQVYYIIMLNYLKVTVAPL